MEDWGNINTVLSGIRNTIPILRSLLEKAPNEGVSTEFTRQLNDAIIEMQQVVIDAQELVLSAQSRETALSARIQELERANTRQGEWAKEKLRYELVNLGGNRGMAYALREDIVAEGEAKHYLCTNCYEDGIKSIIQPTGMSIKPYVCPRCNR